MQRNELAPLANRSRMRIPPEPEDKEKYRSWYMQYISPFALPRTAVEHNIQIDPEVKHILGLIEVNKETLMRIQPMIKRVRMEGQNSVSKTSVFE